MTRTRTTTRRPRAELGFAAVRHFFLFFPPPM